MTNDIDITKQRQMTIDSLLHPGEEPEHVRCALGLIKTFEEVAVDRNPRGYAVAYSGGKDSDILVDLFIRAGVKFFVFHSHTTIDAPETVYHIRKNFEKWRAMGIECDLYMPKKSFWKLCVDNKIFPNRVCRFCCSELKEQDPLDIRYATHVFGVRRAESVRRKHRDSIELSNNRKKEGENFHFDNAEDVLQSGTCYRKKYFFINPIAYWTDEQVWDYIEDHGVEVNPLYAKGWKRVGCIGCPLETPKRRLFEYQKYPAYFCRLYKVAQEISRLRAEEGKQLHHATAESLMRDYCYAHTLRGEDVEAFEKLLDMAKEKWGE